MNLPAPESKTTQQYRYHPVSLTTSGPARLFPYRGILGLLWYVIAQLRQHHLKDPQLSAPLRWLFIRFGSGAQKLDQLWVKISTLLVDIRILQSDWFNSSLPTNEQFDSPFVRQRRTMGKILTDAKKAAKSAGSDPEQMRSRFYECLEANGRSRPAVIAIHERDGGLSDREFARQRLAGQNPMILRRVQDSTILQPFLSQIYTLANQDTIDLTEAAENHQLFVADYPLFKELIPQADRHLQPGRYMGNPVALFYRSEKGLMPIALQWDSAHSDSILAPSHSMEPDAWMRAKLYVQVADVIHHELVDHLVNTHLSMEAFAIATPRQLHPAHPVYRLLKPHFRHLLAINTRGNTILLSEGAVIDTLMAPQMSISLDLMNQYYNQHGFPDLALPNNIRQRGIEVDYLSEFPYRDDALLLWEAIARYVTQYLTQYYPNDQSVQQDVQLQAWAAELGSPLSSRSVSEFPQTPPWMPQDWRDRAGFSPKAFPVGKASPKGNRPRVPHFPNTQTPGQILRLSTLIDAVTQIIFICGPQHAAVNFSQFDYAGYMPNSPFAVYHSPLETNQPFDQFLPNPDRDLGQMEITFALSGIRWSQFGSSEAMQFTEMGDRAALEHLQANLADIEQTIIFRNQKRMAKDGIDYPYLRPSRIPNSINI